MPAKPPRHELRWDIFCRVVDNFGDIGVCWRLATQLAAAGDTVRLFADDASALTWMAPDRGRTQPRVTVRAWPSVGEAHEARDVADFVIEAFGCDPPAGYVRAMQTANPVWINLEYLSAEAYVERSHGLRSPRTDGQRKWFFYPGFTPGTGGLLREPGLLQRRASFDRDAWLAAQGWPRRAGERVVSLFCYDGAPGIAGLIDALADAPTLLLLTPGAAQHLVQALPARSPLLRRANLPFLSQVEFDHLLWASDLNGVRGEDSLVRALWAGAPFLWHIYPQADGAHAAKLRALCATLALPEQVAQAQLAWNGLAPWPGLPAGAEWGEAVHRARHRLLGQDDLAAQLRRFVGERTGEQDC